MWPEHCQRTVAWESPILTPLPSRDQPQNPLLALLPGQPIIYSNPRAHHPHGWPIWNMLRCTSSVVPVFVSSFPWQLSPPAAFWFPPSTTCFLSSPGETLHR